MHARLTHASLTYATQSRGAAARGLWVGRWLLLLVLIWDLVGAPLHPHHHDVGLDGHSFSASSPRPQAGPVASDGHEDSRISHAALALRSHIDPAVAPLGDNPHCGIPGALSLPAVAGPSGLGMAWAGRTGPFKTYRSLPPAGRAPPLHS